MVDTSKLGAIWLFVLFVYSLSFRLHAGNETRPIRVAVAANFKPTLDKLVTAYLLENSSVDIQLSSASSGVLYAQLLRGAPFDIFLSADALRPKLLEEKNVAKAYSRVTYAIGQLFLWTPNIVKPHTLTLQNYDGKIAIANPKLAPFGRASMETLQSLGIWEQRQNSLVKANNVSQVWQILSSGAAQVGLLAASQVQEIDRAHLWKIPSSMHQPIEQQMIIIDNPQQYRLVYQQVNAFYRYVLGKKGQALIVQSGYLLKYNNQLVSSND
jgi:molybdate transport system substrate-binding protein